MRIGLLDHMGYGNLGDAATQDVLIANIKMRLPSAEIVGFSLNPGDTRKRHGIQSYSITCWHPGLNKPQTADSGGNKPRLQLKQVLKQIPVFSPIARSAQHLIREFIHIVRTFGVLRSLDSLIIAGGGQLSELWRGPWSHPYNIFKFSVLATLARRKLLFLNVGAGPLETHLGKFFVKSSLQLADYVSFRDVQSQHLVEQIGVERRTHVFPDSVYALDVSDYKRAASRRRSRPVVGINPIGFGDPRTWPRSQPLAYARYLDHLAEFCRWLSTSNYRIKIFSGEASVDEYAIEDLKERLRACPSIDCADAFGGHPHESITDLLADISSFDFVVTSKFHGVVFSYLLEKPVIALSYHRKIDDLMRIADQEGYSLGIESFQFKDLASAFAAVVSDSQMLKSKVNQTTAAFSKALKEQFDAVFVSEQLQSKPLERGAARNRAVSRGAAQTIQSPRGEER